jgi:RHH-type rel operon transcriptional repressor/antitoxin RelB
MISIELPAELESRLDELARETGRTVDYYVIEAVVEHLDDIEDLRIAEKRWSDICAGREKTVPLEEVMREHGLLED